MLLKNQLDRVPRLSTHFDMWISSNANTDNKLHLYYQASPVELGKSLAEVLIAWNEVDQNIQLIPESTLCKWYEILTIDQVNTWLAGMLVELDYLVYKDGFCIEAYLKTISDEEVIQDAIDDLSMN